MSETTLDTTTVIKPGLSRTRALLEKLGNPEKKLRLIHVAGSNGKGSTCAMIESVLRAAGYRTGLFTSPAVESMNEIFRICGVPIREEVLNRLMAEVTAAAAGASDAPSPFEINTAAALLHFHREQCDIAILETGMGGTLDSTNVIPAPEAAVITNIGLEHTEYLGNTIEEIARAKAGIIKAGSDVICYQNTEEVLDVIRHRCAAEGCPLFITDPKSTLRPVSKSLTGQTFLWQDLRLTMPLLGAHQLSNAAVALTALSRLSARGFTIPDEALIKGFASVRWPVRFEVIRTDPVFIIDCAHNPQCAEALAGMIQEYLPGEKVTLLMGVLADKDYRKMIGILAPFCAEFVCITPDSPRALPAEKLAALLRERGHAAEAFSDVEAAVHACLSTGRPTVTCTSLYVSGRVRRIAALFLSQESDACTPA